MDIADLSHEATMLPTGAFEDSPQNVYKTQTSQQTPLPWTQSPLNPQTRIDSLEPLESPSFRIDGCGEQGSRLFIVPLFLAPRIPPLRIDLYIPKPGLHPPELHSILQSNESCHIQDSRVASLGISTLVLRGLESWIGQEEEMKRRFQDLPFGSHLEIGNVPRHAERMKISVFPGYGVERELLSVDRLRAMWDVDLCEMPETVDIGDLDLQMQVRDSISIIRIASQKERGPLIFKTNIDNTGYLYHELKKLLTIPSHPSIMGRPLHLVTKRCCFGGKVGICGFLLTYYPSGTLGNVLSPSPPHAHDLNNRTKWRWACQITSALIHIRQNGKTFYPDLRPDNVLISSSDQDCSRAILIDLEQRGNWSSWTAPEVRLLEYLEILACPLNTHDSVLQTSSLALLNRYGIPSGFRIEKRRRPYKNTHPGASRAWTSLGPEGQESAMVYALGKLLWCIFEGVSDTSLEGKLWTSTALEGEDMGHHREFPEFREIRSEELRELVRACTRGAPEWEGKVFPLVRIGEKVYSRESLRDFYVSGNGSADDAGRSRGVDVAYDARSSLKKFWEEKIKAVRPLLGSERPALPAWPRPSLREVLVALEKMKAGLSQDI